MLLKAGIFCLATTLGVVAGIWLDKTEPSVSDQMACDEAGGFSLLSATGVPLCIRRDALLLSPSKSKIRVVSPIFLTQS